MYYFVDMYNDKLNFIDGIDNEKCKEVLEASNSVKEVLKFHILGQCVCDALDELTKWSDKTPRGGNYLMRNLHTAERLVRGYLFEFRTCLDHMETEIKRKYGENSTLWNIFKTNTSDAYDKHPEYAFTYHLRNYSQHCKNVVHGFNCDTGIGISSNTKTLLVEYDKWKQVDIKYMVSCGSDIDLLKTFSKAFSAFNTSLAPVVQYLLNTNDVGNNLQYLRRWGDSLQTAFHHDINCFHIVNIAYNNGKDATHKDIAKSDVVINAQVIDWEMIYELSDSVNVTKPLTHN